MASLREKGYDQAIKAWIAADRPFLGICIGLQLLFESSEEAPPGADGAHRGLAVLPGTVRLFPGRKVPQIGWNKTRPRAASRLFNGGTAETYYYYIHSYYAEPEESAAIAAFADYYLPFCAAVERGALAAVQFHPEKSGAAGLSLLETWCAR